MTDLYSVLGVQKDATPAEIKSAFRKRAMETHPDRGGKQEDFIQVRAAYDVLCDPDLRAKYDRGETVQERPINEPVPPWPDFMDAYNIDSPADDYLDGVLPRGLMTESLDRKGMILNTPADMHEAKLIELSDRIDDQLQNRENMPPDQRWSIDKLKSAIMILKDLTGFRDEEYAKLLEELSNVEDAEALDRELDLDAELFDFQEEQFDKPANEQEARFRSDLGAGAIVPYSRRRTSTRGYDRGRKIGARGHRRGDDHNPGGQARHDANRFHRRKK